MNNLSFLWRLYVLIHDAERSMHIHDLTPSQKIVLSLVAYLFEKEGGAKISLIVELCEQYGFARPTVFKCLNALVCLELVMKDRRGIYKPSKSDEVP